MKVLMHILMQINDEKWQQHKSAKQVNIEKDNFSQKTDQEDTVCINAGIEVYNQIVNAKTVK